MTIWRQVPVVLTALVIASTGAAQEPTLERDAERQVGHVATLCGTVVEYQCSGRERTSMLALERPFTEPGVTVAFTKETRERFGTLFEQRTVFSHVCATGRVERQKNRYVVRVDDIDRLVVRSSSPSVPTFDADSVSGCDTGVTLPKLLKRVTPGYSSQAANDRVQGDVLFEALVLADGRVGAVRVLRSVDPRLHAKGGAIKAWRFKPGTREGKTVPVFVTVELTFRLE